MKDLKYSVGKILKIDLVDYDRDFLKYDQHLGLNPRLINEMVKEILKYIEWSDEQMISRDQTIKQLQLDIEELKINLKKCQKK